METGKSEKQPVADESGVPKTSKLAIWSLVCGPLGFVSVGVGGIFAIVLGHRALAEIKEFAGTAKGRGIAIAGLVIGYLSVVVVVGSITSAVYSLKQEGKRAKLAQVTSDFRSLEIALSMYKASAGHYPSTEQGLQALVEPPGSDSLPKSSTQIMSREMIDRWGVHYRYRFSGAKDPTRPEILSNGPDGVAGTADDLSSEDAP